MQYAGKITTQNKRGTLPSRATSGAKACRSLLILRKAPGGPLRNPFRYRALLRHHTAGAATDK
jgi:hypothetical protein